MEDEGYRPSWDLVGEMLFGPGPRKEHTVVTAKTIVFGISTFFAGVCVLRFDEMEQLPRSFHPVTAFWPKTPGAPSLEPFQQGREAKARARAGRSPRAGGGGEGGTRYPRRR